MAADLDRLCSPSGVFVAQEDGGFMPPRHPRYLLRIGRRRPLVRGDELLLGEVELLREAGQLDELLAGGVLRQGSRRPAPAQRASGVEVGGMADPAWSDPADMHAGGGPGQVARVGRRRPTQDQRRVAPRGFDYGDDGVLLPPVVSPDRSRPRASPSPR